MLKRFAIVLLLGLSPAPGLPGPSLPLEQGVAPPRPAPDDVVTLTAAPVAREISSGGRHRYTIDLEAGHYLLVEVEQQPIDVGASLVAPDGSTLAEVAFRHAGPVVLSAIVNASGTYSLEIRSLETGPAAGRYVAAIKELRRAEPRDADRVAGARLFAEAEALRSAWRLDSTTASLERYRAALDRWRAADDQPRQALAARRLGDAYHALGKPDEALPYVLESLRLGRLAADTASECAALSAAARVYLDLGKTSDATDHIQQARQLSRQTLNRSGEADALNVLGDIYAFTGRTRESVDLYGEALSISRALLDRRGEAQALLNLGYSYSDLSQVADAQGSYEAALARWRAVDDRRGEGATLTGLGNLHFIVGENQQALASYLEAREILEGLGDRVGLATILNGIGLVDSRSGDAETAVTYYSQAVELFRSAKYQNGEATSLLVLGSGLISLGRHQEALARYFEALALVRATSNRRIEARALEPIGHAYAQLGDLEKALTYYGQSRSIAHAVGDPRGEVYASNGIGEALHQLGRHDDALRTFDEALRVSEGSKDRFGESLVLYNVARTEAALDHLDQALTRVRASLDLVEALRSDVASLDLRALYLASVRDRYELEIDLLMRLNERNPGGTYDVRAFEASERARARAFLDGLAQARAGIREGADPGLLEREASLRRSLNATARRFSEVPNDAAHAKELTDLSTEIDKLTAADKEIEAQIRARSPRYAALMQPQPLALSRVQELVVDRQSVLLQYFLGKSRSYVWAVTHDGITGHVLPPRDEIERRVRPYVEALTAPERLARGAEASRANALELGQMLLGPVSASLTVPRVLVVSDGILNSLPFATLPDPRSRESNAAPVPLIVEHEVVVMPSASTLALIRGDWQQERHWQKAAMVLADPVYEADDPRMVAALGRAPAPAPPARSPSPAKPTNMPRRTLRDVAGFGGSGIPRLLETRREARSIATLASPSDVALDFNASRTTATSPDLANHRIVHFATHGIVDNDHPELSGIILSLFDEMGQAQDGFLRLHDIYNLKLPVDLVVLSACSTGLGKDIAGEGLIGLVRGFMYAGSRRVVASLWKVDDEATSELMARFYRGIFEKKLPASAALRAAQLELLNSRRWNHPFYWAAFVMQGDWNEPRVDVPRTKVLHHE